MENLWAILARQVYANNKQNTSVLELKEAISKVYDEIGQDVLQSLVQSMPNRIFQVIHRHGGPTDY
jgi:hypothetical protein